MKPFRVLVLLTLVLGGTQAIAEAQSSILSGVVRDETGGVLPGATVELHGKSARPILAVTAASGTYRFDVVPPGQYDVLVALPNFAPVSRPIDVPAGGAAVLDVVLHLVLNADITVTGKRSFANLADIEDPARNLVGIAQSASQGAITAAQLAVRPILRAGEVLETVPGVVISQHSGEGKANQYYLRGFNLDHGTDFATDVAGMPVNMPTHAHGHGYSDSNFLIPELVSGVQFSKGPYFADQGDFATAGAANISYADLLDTTLVRVGGGDGYSRALVAASRDVRAGRLLAAFEANRNEGPWIRPDAYRRLNGVIRYSRGDSVSGFALTGMGYRGTWNSTDQIPRRGIAAGLIGRFGAIDATDGGDTYRYSGSLEWQRTSGNGVTKLTAYGIGYGLDLLSNFTYFLEDPEHGDQFEQVDTRLVTGGKLSHRHFARWGDRAVQHTIGLQLRNDDIGTLGLYHTEARRRLETVREDSVLQTSGAFYAQNEVEWAPWLRTIAGIRIDGYRFRVDAADPATGGTAHAGLASPKGGAIFGPWRGTELYVNAGYGFHSNDARGATITRDPARGEPADRVGPLVRAKGAEIGLRSVAIPHLQSTLTLWALGLDSELLFAGDAGTTEAGRPSHRYGIEWANYYSPRPWLTLDGDLAWSQARFTDADQSGDRIPGSVRAVASAGVTLDAVKNVFGSVRLRYVAPRPLIENNSIRSRQTTIVNVAAGYTLPRGARLTFDVFNLLDVRDSDIDYYYTSRIPGEPADGVNDLHFHPTQPRTARVSLMLGF